MAQLIAALPDFLIFSQNTVHAPPGTQILTFIQQGGIGFTWGTVLKTLTVEFLTHFDFFRLAEGARRNLCTTSLRARSPSTI
jgi:hypothetical protein